jgi:hypothetical protein
MLTTANAITLYELISIEKFLVGSKVSVLENLFKKSFKKPEKSSFVS